MDPLKIMTMSDMAPETVMEGTEIEMALETETATKTETETASESATCLWERQKQKRSGGMNFWCVATQRSLSK